MLQSEGDKLITVVFHFKAAFLMTRSSKTGLKLENFRLSSDDIAKKPYFSSRIFHFYAAHFYAGFDKKSQNLSSRYFPVLCRFYDKILFGSFFFKNFESLLNSIDSIRRVIHAEEFQ
jgi:hypothetical protein